MLGIDRKAVPKKLEVTYRRNRASYFDLRGRPTWAKPLYHRDPAVEIVPSRFATSLSDPFVTETGTGRLELILDPAATMPVAAVDGEVVAVGEGTVYLVLPVGPHVVEVQGGDTCSPIVVDVKDQEKTSLTWLEEADRRTRSFGSGIKEIEYPYSRVYLYEWLSTTFLICCFPTGILQVILLAFDQIDDVVASRVIIGIVIAIAVILVVFFRWKRRERVRVDAKWDLYLNKRGSGGQVRPRHYPWDGPAADDRPVLLGEAPESLPGFMIGGGALLLRTKANRHLWKEGDGVSVRDVERARLHVEPPTVRIDGFEQPATWGNWWYPLQPGKHVIEVEFDADLTGVTPQLISASREIEVRAGEAAAVRADAHVFVDRGPGENGPVQAREGLLFLKPEEFNVAEMHDLAKRLEFWNARP